MPEYEAEEEADGEGEADCKWGGEVVVARREMWIELVVLLVLMLMALRVMAWVERDCGCSHALGEVCEVGNWFAAGVVDPGFWYGFW